MNKNLKLIFDRAVEAVFGLILVFLFIGIAIGALQLSLTVWSLFKLQGITGHYIKIIADVLTLYVLIELARSLVDYFYNARLRMTYIIDAALVFVLRETLIGLFKEKIDAEMIYALSALIFVLGALRIASMLVNLKEQHVFSEGTPNQPTRRTKKPKEST